MQMYVHIILPSMNLSVLPCLTVLWNLVFLFMRVRWTEVATARPWWSHTLSKSNRDTYDRDAYNKWQLITCALWGHQPKESLSLLTTVALIVDAATYHCQPLTWIKQNIYFYYPCHCYYYYYDDYWWAAMARDTGCHLFAWFPRNHYHH